MKIDPTNFPAVPSGSTPYPRPLYVSSGVSEEESAQFLLKGWRVTDVRLLESRAEAVRATLEGVRMGTIVGDKELLSFLQLEARIEKLLLNKEAQDNESGESLDSDDISAILDFGVPVKLPPRPNDKAEPTKTRRGRPPKPRGLKA